MTDTEAIAYLMRDGNLRVPGSRYGHDTATCAPVAVRAARIVANECGEPLEQRDLDYAMGLAVNDSPDIQNVLDDFGG